MDIKEALREAQDNSYIARSGVVWVVMTYGGPASMWTEVTRADYWYARAVLRQMKITRALEALGRREAEGLAAQLSQATGKWQDVVRAWWREEQIAKGDNL